MKYIIIICFMLLSIACAAQLESASPNLIIKYGFDVDTVSLVNPIGRGFYLPSDTTINIQRWEGSSFFDFTPVNIYDSILEIQKQVLEKLEIIQKQIEVIKRLDGLLNTYHSTANAKTYEFIESIKTDSSLYRKQK